MYEIATHLLGDEGGNGNLLDSIDIEKVFSFNIDKPHVINWTFNKME